MKKRSGMALLIGTQLLSTLACADTPAAGKAAQGTPPSAPAMNCPSQVDISPTLPFSVANNFLPGYQAFSVKDQPCFDMFSWQGRSAKRPSAVLRFLGIESLFLRNRALRLAALRFAISAN